MSFVTLKFLLFLTTFLLLFYVAPKKIRWVVVLISSYLFYAIQEPVFVVLIAISTTIDYFCAKYIAQVKLKRLKKLFLGLRLNPATWDYLSLGVAISIGNFWGPLKQTNILIHTDNAQMSFVLIALCQPGGAAINFSKSTRNQNRTTLLL